MIVCIGGLMGSGKSTVAEAVAQKLQWDFFEADSLLSAEIKEKVSRGVLMTQAELDAWIYDGVIPRLVADSHTKSVVASVIFTKNNVEWLDKLAADVLYINLEAPYDVLKARVEAREYFAGTEMLKLSWKVRDTLKLPGPTVDATQTIEEVVAECVQHIKTHRGT